MKQSNSSNDAYKLVDAIIKNNNVNAYEILEKILKNKCAKKIQTTLNK
jgi:hypothetical protein